MRRVQRLGLAPRYTQDSEARKWIRSLVALAFLQIDEVLPAFEVINNQKPEGLQMIYDYFREYFL